MERNFCRQNFARRKWLLFQLILCTSLYFQPNRKIVFYMFFLEWKICYLINLHVVFHQIYLGLLRHLKCQLKPAKEVLPNCKWSNFWNTKEIRVWSYLRWNKIISITLNRTCCLPKTSARNRKGTVYNIVPMEKKIYIYILQWR